MKFRFHADFLNLLSVPLCLRGKLSFFILFCHSTFDRTRAQVLEVSVAEKAVAEEEAWIERPGILPCHCSLTSDADLCPRRPFSSTGQYTGH